jgi:hypothetical protein
MTHPVRDSRRSRTCRCRECERASTAAADVRRLNDCCVTRGGGGRLGAERPANEQPDPGFASGNARPARSPAATHRPRDIAARVGAEASGRTVRDSSLSDAISVAGRDPARASYYRAARRGKCRRANACGLSLLRHPARCLDPESKRRWTLWEGGRPVQRVPHHRLDSHRAVEAQPHGIRRARRPLTTLDYRDAPGQGDHAVPRDHGLTRIPHASRPLLRDRPSSVQSDGPPRCVRLWHLRHPASSAGGMERRRSAGHSRDERSQLHRKIGFRRVPARLQDGPRAAEARAEPRHAGHHPALTPTVFC